jgi:predicted GIY-YIG superfamily endonuclease
LNNKVTKCVQCRIIRWKNEASINGLEYLSHVNNIKAKYRLPCGCIKDIAVGSVRGNIWACDTHSNWWNKNSCVYLIRCNTENFSWLKIGVSVNVDRRITEYYFKQETSVDIICMKSFLNFKEATNFEKVLHRKYSNLNISHEHMKNYKKSGWSECYPLELKEILLKELNE